MSEAKDIGERLVDRGILTADTLRAARLESEQTQEALTRVLVHGGHITRQQLLHATVGDSDRSLSTEPFYSDRVPDSVLLRLRVMLMGDLGNTLYLSTDSPRAYVQRALRPYFPGRVFQFVGYEPDRFEEYMEELERWSSAPDSLDGILRSAVRRKVSDIHLVPKAGSYTLMFRELGVRQLIRDLSVEEASRIIAQAKDRASLDIAERRVPHDGAFREVMLGRPIDCRVATIPEVEGEAMVIRVLDPEATSPALGDLGMRESDQEAWRAAFGSPFGLCLVCGPTGSGKSTTLNATIREMDRYGRAIYTVEEPVEYRLSFLGQVEVNRATGLGFAEALRSFLRGDPDVIVVGEIRDYETAMLAVRAADTGHLVLATLHADSNRAAIDRLIEMGVPIENFADRLRGILSQRLVRTTCPACVGAGCAECHDLGYDGRTMLAEVSRFRNRKEVERFRFDDERYETMLDHGFECMREEIVAPQELRRVFGNEFNEAMALAPDGELPPPTSLYAQTE